MPPKRKAEKGKKWRQDLNNAKRDRNWTDLETEAFCEILADPEFSFSTTLETKALKKQANKEVFEEIQKHLKTSFEDPGFLEENQDYLDEDQQKELDVSIDKLRNKYIEMNSMMKYAQFANRSTHS